MEENALINRYWYELWKIFSFYLHRSKVVSVRTLKCMTEIDCQQRAGLTAEQKSAVSPRPSLPAALTVPGQSGTFWFTSDPAAVWPEDDRVSFKTIIGAVWPVIRHCSPAGLRARPGHRLKCACLLPPQWQPNGPCLLASSMSSSAVYCRTCTSPRLSSRLCATHHDSLCS